MADGDGGEQQQLSNVGTDVSQTWQERIITLYNSNKTLHIALGFWMKLLYEGLVVGAPLSVLVLIGIVLTYLGIAPFDYLWYGVGWSTATLTILSFSWCFAESSIEADSSDST